MIYQTFDATRVPRRALERERRSATMSVPINTGVRSWEGLAEIYPHRFMAETTRITLHTRCISTD